MVLSQLFISCNASVGHNGLHFQTFLCAYFLCKLWIATAWYFNSFLCKAFWIAI